MYVSAWLNRRSIINYYIVDFCACCAVLSHNLRPLDIIFLQFCITYYFVLTGRKLGSQSIAPTSPLNSIPSHKEGTSLTNLTLVTMIGRVVLLSAAAYASAGSLRGEGVEEVGEQIEFFPPEDLDVGSDRRHLVDKESEARAMMEDYFDEWPEEAVVGHVVENEDEIYVDEYQLDGKEDTFEDIQPLITPLGGVVGEGTAEEGEAKDEQEPPSVDDSLIKLYAPDPNSVPVSIITRFVACFTHVHAFLITHLPRLVLSSVTISS